MNTKSTAAGEKLSLRPFVHDDDTEILSPIRRFKAVGERDDRLTVAVPLYERRALETLRNDAGGRTTMNNVALWALAVGLKRFEDWSEIETICEARETLLRCGSADLTQVDVWRFQLAARDGHDRLFLRCISPVDAGRCATIAHGLGLATSTFGALAIMAGIVDAPLPGELPRLLLSELREFRRGLRRRATLAEELSKRALSAPQSKQKRVSWEDVTDEE